MGTCFGEGAFGRTGFYLTTYSIVIICTDWGSIYLSALCHLKLPPRSHSKSNKFGNNRDLRTLGAL